jgi:predicted glycosyltransferase
MYIGDSQTMAAEAAVLGTPSLRFNDFVGKLGYLEELEHKYGLTYGIKTAEPEKLYQKIEELLHVTDLSEEWQRRKRKMLSEKIDVTAFMVWFVENYPESVVIMKDNPDYQYKFQSVDFTD